MDKQKKISMQDIADHLGVSKNSVSLALSGKIGISDKLRVKIFDAAVLMGYAGYSNLSELQKHNVLIICSDFYYNDALLFQKMIMGIEKYGAGKGVNIVTRTISHDRQSLIFENMNDLVNISGCLVIGHIDREYISFIEEKKVPFVLIDNSYPGVSYHCLIPDNYGGGVTAVNHLISKGHREIGFIGPILLSDNIYNRYCGYEKAILKSGLTYYKKYCITDFNKDPGCIIDIDYLEEKIRQLDSLPSAFFCASDSIALVLYKVLLKLGISVPEDVSVVGFGNFDYLDMIIPSITSIGVDRISMGNKAFDILFDQIHGQSGEPYEVSLPCSLIHRESVKEKHSSDLNKSEPQPIII